MPIKSLSQSSLTNFQKYSSMLAGNAAFRPSAYDLLDSTILTSTATSVSFTGLNAFTDYKHLQLRFTARNNYNDVGVGPTWIRFNNVSSGYNYQPVFTSGSSVSGILYTSQTEFKINQTNPYNQEQANTWGAGIVDIPQFLNTSNAKTILWRGGFSGTQNRGNYGYGWNGSTTAISSIQVISDTATSFLAGSRFSIYGVK